jgi:hypothetical protein
LSKISDNKLGPETTPAAAETPGQETQSPTNFATDGNTLARDTAASAPNLDWPQPSSPVDVSDLDWSYFDNAPIASNLLSRASQIGADFEKLLLLKAGPGLLFDAHRSDPQDRAIQVGKWEDEHPLWFIGDLHGDLLALEAALLLIRNHPTYGSAKPKIVFLGDLFDDGGYGLETLLKVFELANEAPDTVCIIAGNHDEALGHDGARFTSLVEPDDFSDLLNQRLAEEHIARLGKLAIKFFSSAPRALFLPDGLLVAHGGFPLADLHAHLWETGNWNDSRCLTDFVWTRAHPTARKKMPNRHSKGSQFGHEDFSTFCSLATSLGRTVTHMVRGHDHVESRFAVYPAYSSHPILTTNALSRRLAREFSGQFQREPTIALYKRHALPQVFRIQLPQGLFRSFYGHEVGQDAQPSDEGTPS